MNHLAAACFCGTSSYERARHGGAGSPAWHVTAGMAARAAVSCVAV